MKTLFTSAIFFSLLVFVSCTETYVGPEGPMGPQGPRGYDGVDGVDGESAYVFEWTGVTFNAPEYEVILPYPDSFTGVSSDVTLVYFLWDTYETNDGELVEVWRQLPQTILTDDGALQYNYDFSMYDVRLFMDAEFPLDILGAIDTDDWIARVVIVPGNIWNGGRVDFSDYNEVVKALNLPDIKGNYTGQPARR